jgi:hypothetical protein
MELKWKGKGKAIIISAIGDDAFLVSTNCTWFYTEHHYEI